MKSMSAGDSKMPFGHAVFTGGTSLWLVITLTVLVQSYLFGAVNSHPTVLYLACRSNYSPIDRNSCPQTTFSVRERFFMIADPLRDQ